ncbi:MAG TPA: hypothetical protein VLD67_13250, partial [Vicinamibacterales bacterium]|nr:hypothetical protein [Vicinamibacterales bacterium]
PFFVDNSVGASIRRALGARFDVMVSADRHRYEYYEALTSPTVASGLAPLDITWNYAGSIGYRLGREGRIGVGASYWTRDSTRSDERDYDNLRVGASLSYGF